jgi:signal peptide peptidase SppA
MSSNPLIARFAGEPALIEPQGADRFRACLEAVAAHPHAAELLSEQAAAGDDFWSFDPDSYLARLRPYVVADGVLQIPIKGVLLHNFPYALGGWATGYDYIWRAFQRGCADYAIGAIRGIALMIDSPGGMVAGCFDAVDRAFALKQETGVPVRAFAHESAYSAAYAWFSLADQGVVSRTGGVGSIGVVTSHMDVSKALDEAGYRITFIHAGKHKVDGNPYEALSAEVKARIQARIDELYEVFVSTVARNRPVLSEEVIRETEALTFTATQAVSNKLADSIGSLDDALSAFVADLSATDGDEQMAVEANTTAVDQAAHEAAVTAAREEGRLAGVAEGTTAAVARINAILGSDEGKARPKAALSAALKTTMTAEEATAFLADLAEEKSEAAAPAPTAETETPFDAAMELGNPNVGANREQSAEAQDDGSDVLALARAHGIKGFNRPAAA